MPLHIFRDDQRYRNYNRGDSNRVEPQSAHCWAIPKMWGEGGIRICGIQAAIPTALAPSTSRNFPSNQQAFRLRRRELGGISMGMLRRRGRCVAPFQFVSRLQRMEPAHNDDDREHPPQDPSLLHKRNHDDALRLLAPALWNVSNTTKVAFHRRTPHYTI